MPPSSCHTPLQGGAAPRHLLPVQPGSGALQPALGCGPPPAGRGEVLWVGIVPEGVCKACCGLVACWAEEGRQDRWDPPPSAAAPWPPTALPCALPLPHPSHACPPAIHLFQAEALAASWGCRSMALHVDPSNTAAIKVGAWQQLLVLTGGAARYEPVRSPGSPLCRGACK